MDRRRRWTDYVSSAAVVPLTPVDRARYFRFASIARTVAIALLATVFLWFIRDEPTWALFVAAAVLYPGVGITWVLLRRHGVLPAHVWLRDLVTLGVVAAIVPELFVVSMMASLAILVFCSFTVWRHTTVLLSVVAVVATAAAAAFHPTGGVVLGAALFPLAVAATVLPAQVSSEALQRSIDFNTRIADALQVALFESSGVAGEPTTMYHLYAPSNRRFPNRLTEDEWLAILHPDDRAVSDAIDEAVAEGRDYQFRYRQRIERHGEYRWIEEVAHVERHGDLVSVQGMTRDIHDSVVTEQHLQRLDVMADMVDVSISVLRLDDPADPTSLTVVWENRMARRVDGRDHTGLRVIDVNRHTFDTERHRGIGYLMAEVALGAPTVRITDAHLRLGDDDRLFSVVCSPLPDHHCAVVMNDVTELWSARAELERLAYVDGLTGLPNRIRFRESLAAAPVGSTLFVLDLDRFTDVNEAFGHGCGDEMIVEVARVLCEAPEGAVVARLGGDEFGILTPPGIAPRDELVARIFHALSLPAQLPNGLTLQVAASMGIATKTRVDTPADELLRQADVALNRAKQYRNTHEVYDARNDTSAPHRMMLLGELRRALTSGELELHHQPAVSATTGEVTSVEALLVWRHPSLGLLSAHELAEMIDLSNLHADIVVYSLREAIAHHRSWREQGHFVPVSINVSGATMHDPALVDKIARIVADAGLPDHAIGIELDEIDLRLGRLDASATLRRLSEAGLWLTIDHFGSGRTAFSALRAAGVDAIKLDHRAIVELLPADDALLASMADLLHGLGVLIAGEGADDETTFRWLVSHGVDQVQGDFVAPVMDPDEMLAFLRSYRPAQLAR